LSGMGYKAQALFLFPSWEGLGWVPSEKRRRKDEKIPV